MLFNSIEFFGFLVVVFAAYWAVKGRRTQNVLLLVASYVFYVCWDWRFLALLVWISAVAHVCAGLASTGPRGRGRYGVWTICLVGLGALGLFKYFNFFTTSFAALSAAVGLTWSPVMLKLGLPMGISFFTFKAISYVVDCYKGKIAPSKSWLETFLYVGFFPQIAAGPIDRATNLMPQFAAVRTFDFDRATRGLAQIVYGLFKKMVVADTLCMYVDKAFANPELYGLIACLIAAIFYSIQIYCDFSGYSDVACGTCRLLGFEPMLNFDRPYLSRTFSEFWRRWHISLSFWFRDYVYIPLGGSRVPFWKIVRNLWIVFLLSGLWHGAAWTFVIWGGLHALFQTFGLMKRKMSRNAPPSQKLTHIALDVALVNLGVTFAWIFFRAESFSNAMKFVSHMVMDLNFKVRDVIFLSGGMTFAFICAALLIFIGSEFMSVDFKFKTRKGLLAFLTLQIVAIVFLSASNTGEFIYQSF